MHLSQPGYPLNDYLLLVHLPEELSHQIKRIKKKFALDYQAPKASSQPFLLLSSFSAFAPFEERIIARIEGICRAITPFKIELRDFGAFPSHTIYVNVISKVPVNNLVKEIKKAQQLLKPDKDHKPYFIDEAHVAICKNLKPWQFEKGWLEYSHHEFTGRFIAAQLVLLKKNNKGFDNVNAFKFLGAVEKISQGNLF